MSLLPEYWRPVTGYEGLYEASNHGRVRSLPRLMTTGRIISPVVNSRGYWVVSLSRDGVVKQLALHRVILMSFIGPRPEGMHGCHNNGDKSGNTLGNLRWDTPTENRRDIVRHGADFNRRKTHCPKRHEYTPENTHIGNDGYRYCIKCRQEYNERRRLARQKVA